MYYFGYYIQLGCPCSVKWTGDVYPGNIQEMVQVIEVTVDEFKWPLSHLAVIYPFKDLPKLQ